MPTRGQATLFKSNVNSFLALALVASFSCACALLIWHAAFGTNPVEKMLISTTVLN